MNNNQKATKRALLTSVMALVMCVVMLVGTTFAWFTDTASTGVNKIVAGNLKVDIVDKNGVSLDGKTLSFVNKDNSEQILWEPGVTFHTEGFHIKNAGNLALKWKIAINEDSASTGVVEGRNGKQGMNLLDVIDFSVVSSKAKDAEAVKIDEFVGHTAANTVDSTIYYIKGTMQTTAGNDYQNLTLDGITITVYATQDTVENDSFNDQYDADATYPVVVTPDTAASVDYSKSNAVYQFAAGTYSGLSFNVGKNSDVVFEAADGAVFDNVTIGYKVNRYNETDKSEGTMTIRGFHVNGVLSVNSADGNLVIEDNTAKTIKVTMNRQDGKENADIQIAKNKLNGGKYGIELVPNHSGYTLTISGNEFTNITNHAISVMGYQSDLSPTDETRTTAASITVSDNTFNSYGAGKAAFKIWGDTNLAPNGTDALTEAAQALANSVKANNTFGDDLGNTCVVADFFGKKVTFN